MRKILFIFVAGTIVLFLVVIFFAVGFLQRQPSQSPAPTPAIPTRAPGPILRDNTNQTIPPVQYDAKKTDTLVDAAKNRQSLSNEGAAAKQKLISSLNNTSGSVYTSQNVTIDYIKSADLFQAEIKTESVTQAKQEAVNFMITQGFTQQDLCRLPFSFYLSQATRNALKGTDTQFNPLPEGC